MAPRDLSNRRNIVASSNAGAANARHDGGGKETRPAILPDGSIERRGIHREPPTSDGNAHQVRVAMPATRTALSTEECTWAEA